MQTDAHNMKFHQHKEIRNMTTNSTRQTQGDSQMFTHRHFEQIAFVLAGEVRKSSPSEMNRILSTIESMATMFALDNPRFNRVWFMKAAGMARTLPHPPH
jgi:hypothetical protein